MSPAQLLRNKRNALLRDDEAILLLLIGKAERRPHELRKESEIPDRTFWRAYDAIHKQGWIQLVKTRPAGGTRGKRSVCKLTDEGALKVAILMGVKPPPAQNFTLES